MLLFVYTTTCNSCNFHMQVFQIKLKYHCSKPIKLQKFLMQQYKQVIRIILQQSTRNKFIKPTDFNEEFNAFVADLQIPQLSPEESSALESNLTLLELKNVLSSFQSNKSPAEDGFSKEFHETLFDLIGLHLLNSYNDAFNKGQLSISQRCGVTCFIPKDDSCLIELTNWRPLTLLNADFKILAN